MTMSRKKINLVPFFLSHVKTSSLFFYFWNKKFNITILTYEDILRTKMTTIVPHFCEKTGILFLELNQACHSFSLSRKIRMNPHMLVLPVSLRQQLFPRSTCRENDISD